MLTQCPNCDTTFRVTSEILRVAQGQVRCGRCDMQFDAMERLIEEDDATEDSEADPNAATDETDVRDLRLSEPDLEEDAAVETIATEEWVELDVLDADSTLSEADIDVATEQSDAETESFEAEAELEDEEIASESDDAIYDEPAEELEELEDATPPAIIPGRAARSNYAASERRQLLSSTPRAALNNQATAPRQFEDTDQLELIKRPLSVASAAAWKYLAVPLVLLFVFQVFNHYRAPLGRHPRIGPAVNSFYRALGVDLIPDWKLRAYKLQSTPATLDPSKPGTLRVLATVQNRAAFAQPYPLIKVTLEDRYGVAVRAREFKPSEYLDKPPPPDAQLAPRQRITANLSMVDPGRDAASSKVDICLIGNNGPVCTEDLPTPL